MQDLPDWVAENLSLGADRMVALGPVVRQPIAGHRPAWYFVAASYDHEFYVTQWGGENAQIADELRARLIMELFAQARPVIVLDFDGEVELARFCAAAWPGEETRAICKAIEEE